MASFLLFLKTILCLDESRIPFLFKSFNLFECIGTSNHKPFSKALSASSSGINVDDEYVKSFLKRRMLPKNKTLPRKFIKHTKKHKSKQKN